MGKKTEVPTKNIIFMLFSRTIFFIIFQIIIAVILAFSDLNTAWYNSAGWWPFVAIFTNLVSIFLLKNLFIRENKGYFEFYPHSPETKRRDIGLVIILMLIAAPISLIPNLLLGSLLYSDPTVLESLFFRPLPLWAWIGCFAFPFTIAFAELPTYFGYAMPCLESKLKNRWKAWVVSSLFLAFQHIALPLILDWRFMLWRFGMFIPLALYIGVIIMLRPRLFPYMMIGHALIDMMTVLMIPIA